MYRGLKTLLKENLTKMSKSNVKETPHAPLFQFNYGLAWPVWTYHTVVLIRDL